MKVFWSWQSDHPGKISRHFVRRALDEAIAAIKASAEVDEPEVAARAAEIHVDQDTQNERGSIRIAETIFGKIAAATVFVADVTPIAEAPVVPDADSGRRVMNPNVAIELGYFMRGNENDFLTVLNTNYGSFDDIPFDLRHRRRPFAYSLDYRASKSEIDEERAKLSKAFEMALMPYFLASPAHPARVLEEDNAERFFYVGDPIATHSNGQNVFMPFPDVMYLRLSPLDQTDKLIDGRTLRNTTGLVGTLGGIGNGYNIVKDSDVVMFEPAGDTDKADSATWFSHEGQVWGVNADYLRQGDRKDGRLLLMTPIEAAYRTKLPQYLDLIIDRWGYKFPIAVRAGITGIQGRAFGIQGQVIDNLVKMIRPSVHHAKILNDRKPETINEFLLEFFEKIFRAAGVDRPRGLHGFPP